MLVASQWQPGRLLVGWSLGVLTTLGLLMATGGWYEYRQLSTMPASGSPARLVTGQESACEVDKDSAINVGGFEVVPDQPDDCYLRRPRIRPWQWADGLREQLGRLSTRAWAERRDGEKAEAPVKPAQVVAVARAVGVPAGSAQKDGVPARTVGVQTVGVGMRTVDVWRDGVGVRTVGVWKDGVGVGKAGVRTVGVEGRTGGVGVRTAGARTRAVGARLGRTPSTAYDVAARWYDVREYGLS